MSGCARTGATRATCRKRKEWDSSDLRAKPGSDGASSGHPVRLSNSKLLAGYLAHEFLTDGTLFGKRVEEEISEQGRQKGADPVISRVGSESDPIKTSRAYADVAFLLKADGAHLPGVVNPTQLGRRIRSLGEVKATEHRTG